jgi:ketosteroid isomerase-like protein
MTKTRAAALAASLLASPAAQAAPVNAPADVKAITAIEQDVAINLDLKEVITHYARHAVTIDVIAPGVYVGRPQIYSGYAPQFAAVKTISDTMPELNIVSDGTMACAALDMQLTIGMKTGKTIDENIRQLDVYRKIGGKWEIIQEHISVPVDPATGLAALGAPAPARGAFPVADDFLAAPAISPALARGEVKAWTQATATAANIGDVTSAYGPGDAVLIYDEAIPGELRGVPEIAAHYAPLFANVLRASTTMPLLTVDSDGILGAQTSVQNLVLTLKDGKTEAFTFRQTDCLRRVGGKWAAFFENVSFPVDMKTGKSVMAPAT